jgi:hypothetical protein
MDDFSFTYPSSPIHHSIEFRFRRRGSAESMIRRYLFFYAGRILTAAFVEMSMLFCMLWVRAGQARVFKRSSNSVDRQLMSVKD